MGFIRQKWLVVVAVVTACLVGIGALAVAQRGNGPGPTVEAPPRTGAGLASFQSERELRAFLRRIQGARRREFEGATDMAAAPATAEPQAESRGAEPGITNTQEAGVDEGGIVKRSGDYLVILRRGRLFTVSTADGDLQPVDSINTFPPGVEAGNDWYDEMLIAGDRVVVIGYSYRRGGTEINRFRLGSDGHLRFEDAYHLRSNDYYSSRNYASRLIGNRLIYYTPLYLGASSGDPLDALPGLRKWDGKADGAFRRIAGPQQIFIPPALRDRGADSIAALHSVIDCDLTAPELNCSAIGVLGPASRTFYVSPRGVYLWISDWAGRGGSGPNAFIYRLPFGPERPSAIAARGAPVDQFSFREDAADRSLSVLVRAEGAGDAMWNPEVTQGSVALLRVPIADFGDGSREAPSRFYRDLPRPEGQSWSFHNRFVGDHLLYGAGAYGAEAGKAGASVYVVPVRGGPVVTLPLPHSVDRIEVLGRDALVVGGGSGALGFTAIELAGAPRVGDSYSQAEAAEGETRSHAFFYRPDPDSPDGASGLLGLPVARQADPAYRRFFGSSASMLFLRRLDHRFSPAGELAARAEGVVDDGCVASCVDWYGNARPIFLGRRIIALLGYELVEGTFDGGRINEIRRVSFAPVRNLDRTG